MSDGESRAGLFHWFDESFERVEDLAMAAGIEMHGRQVERHATFVDYRPPTNPARHDRFWFCAQMAPLSTREHGCQI